MNSPGAALKLVIVGIIGGGGLFFVFSGQGRFGVNMSSAPFLFGRPDRIKSWFHRLVPCWGCRRFLS
jgi:hypothetical protein